MKIWIDAQLSPLIAQWIVHTLKIEAVAIRELGLRDAGDAEVFFAAQKADAIILTKDSDFPHLLSQHGSPPRIIWLTCGNTSNAVLQCLLKDALPQALNFLEDGERLVEISG